MNLVILKGNLCRDLDLRYAASGMAVASSCIAVTERFKTKTGEKRERTTFVNFTAFGKRGEVMKQYLSKGSPVVITGKLNIDKVEKPGLPAVYYAKVIVDSFEFCGGSRESRNSAPASSEPAEDLSKASEALTFPSSEADDPLNMLGDWGGGEGESLESPDLPSATEVSAPELPDLKW
jgi:single-strand DNA-binding protein